MDRKNKIWLIVLALLLVAAIVVAFVINGDLSASKKSLEAMSTQLATAQESAAAVEAELAAAQESAAALEAELTAAQAELAERLHVTAQAVSLWERGVTTPDIALLPDLACILGCSADTLLGSPASRYRRRTTVQQMREAQEKYNDLMGNVNRILRLVVTGETEDEGSCNGNCAGCAGCH